MEHHEQTVKRKRLSSLAKIPRMQMSSPIETILDRINLQIHALNVSQSVLTKTDLSWTSPNLFAQMNSPVQRVLDDLKKTLSIQSTLRQNLFQDLARTMIGFSEIKRKVSQSLDIYARITKGLLAIQMRQGLSVNPSIMKLDPFLPKLLTSNDLVAPFVTHFHLNLESRLRDSVDELLKAAHEVFFRGQVAAKQISLLKKFNRIPESLLPKKFDAIDFRLGNIDFAGLERIVNSLSNGETFRPSSVGSNEDISDELAEELAGIPDSCKMPIDEKLNFLIAWTEKHDNRHAKEWMVQILIGILSGLFSHCLLEVANSVGNAVAIRKPHTVVRETSILSQHRSISVEPVPHLRMVVRNNVSLKAGRRSQSRTVSRVDSGTLVYLVKGRGKWSQVEWLDVESGLTVSGWVRSKYLARPLKL